MEYLNDSGGKLDIDPNTGRPYGMKEDGTYDIMPWMKGGGDLGGVLPEPPPNMNSVVNPFSMKVPNASKAIIPLKDFRRFAGADSGSGFSVTSVVICIFLFLRRSCFYVLIKCFMIEHMALIKKHWRTTPRRDRLYTRRAL